MSGAYPAGVTDRVIDEHFAEAPDEELTVSTGNATCDHCHGRYDEPDAGGECGKCFWTVCCACDHLTCAAGGPHDFSAFNERHGHGVEEAHELDLYPIPELPSRRCA